MIHLGSIHVNGGVVGDDQLADHAVRGAVQQRLKLPRCLPAHQSFASVWFATIFLENKQKPGHACPAAAGGGHVRPAPCVPGNARRPWRRWMAGALGDIFRCASILQITTESVSHSMLCQLSNQYFFGDLSRSCCIMIRVCRLGQRINCLPMFRIFNIFFDIF